MSSTKRILLVTENQKSEFSEKVISAAELSHRSIEIEPPTFKVFSKVINGQISVVVLDHDELGSIADYFFRAVRLFHSTTPVLMAFSKKIIQEQLFMKAHEKNITPNQLADVMSDAIHIDEEIKSESSLSYSFKKDIDLKRLAEIFVRSIEFNDELNQAKKEFNRLFEERGIMKLTGKPLTDAINEIRKEAYSSPVFSDLRKQMEKNPGISKGDALSIVH